jgi:hypothetical protein
VGDKVHQALALFDERFQILIGGAELVIQAVDFFV